MSLFSSLIPTLGRQAVACRTGDTTAREANTEYTIKPVYEVRETDEAFGVVVHLPGVTKDTLELTAEDGAFVIRGRRAWTAPKEWTVRYRETVDAPYELRLTHDNAIDPDKTHAELKDGVLRVSLPKAEAIKPRKITVS